MRLAAVARLDDGFALAEVDFEQRREGDVLGYAQHGLPRLRVATLARADHRELAVAARPAQELGLVRCPRCWRWVPALRPTAHGEVCPRCGEALNA